ncbi:MAG: hypothetical protein E6G13_12515, partial [Actinobacteria bacterium]
MPIHRCRRVLLVGRERRHRAFEVLADDRGRTTERPKRLEAKPGGGQRPLSLPQPLEHELEERRLDSVARRTVRGCAAAGAAEMHTPDGNVVEHGFDELRLDR